MQGLYGLVIITSYLCISALIRIVTPWDIATGQWQDRRLRLLVAQWHAFS